MAPGRRLGGGCWTCRVRRKRCDSARPVCGSCQSLEITCYSGKSRPMWMDGGVGQKHMSDMIKEEIKQGAILRRERRMLARNNQGTFIATETDSSPHEASVSSLPSHAAGGAADDAAEYVLSTHSTAPIQSTNSVASTTLWSSIDESKESRSTGSIASSTRRSVPLPAGFSPGSPWPTGSAVPIQVQLSSVMIYLDYVFPFLFPFYQPSLIETGRQWLLGLLCQNDVSFHIAASLSAYFFSLVPQSDDQDMHDECKALIRAKLVEQMDMAVRSMQNTVSAINHHGAQSSLLDRTRIMEEIIQLLIVEITVRSDVDWTIHLTPALVLFDEIFTSHDSDHSKPNLATLLSSLPSSNPAGTPHHKPIPNTADQSALVFFVSLLLFIDIVASTSQGTPPTLQSHHGSLVSTDDEGYRVRLEDVVGCQNWALVAVGNISALCAWKRDAKESGNFSVVNLVNLAAPISQVLEQGLASLNQCQSQKKSAGFLEAFYSRYNRVVDHTLIANITRIWAYAATIYLSVTLSGWQTNSTDTQDSVTKVLSLLQIIESPAQLQSLSWPIAVTGCLALPSQEHSFRRIIGLMGRLGEFGTAFDALRIMEAVWYSRHTIDRDNWNITSCLNILGWSALLI